MDYSEVDNLRLRFIKNAFLQKENAVVEKHALLVTGYLFQANVWNVQFVLN